MTKKNLTVLGLAVAISGLAYEILNEKSPKKEMITKTAHIGIGVGLLIICFATIKKD